MGEMQPVFLIPWAGRRNWNKSGDFRELCTKISKAGFRTDNADIYYDLPVGCGVGTIEVQAVFGVIAGLAMAEAELRFVDVQDFAGLLRKLHLRPLPGFRMTS